MCAGRLLASLSLWSGLRAAGAAPLVSSPGQAAAIPSWDLQSSADVGGDLGALSQTGVDTSSWHHVATSKCTLIGCLIHAGVYNDTELFYSDNLRSLDGTQFAVPWIYRSEFALAPAPGRHFFIQTHGISSRADVFLNGRQVASSAEQAGSFVGKRYDITDLAGAANALVIQAHPTDYYRDLALGWVDWNPWPADNGTGVWRDVEIKQTGSVVLGPLRVVTQLGTPLGSKPAQVTLKAQAQNLENSTVTVTAAGLITPLSEGSASPVAWEKTITLPPLSVSDIALEAVVEKPEIWWPRQWGEQPLYTANLTVATGDGEVSDCAAARFGFRTVTSELNAHNDTTFIVNGHPFQVVGAGYAPDMFLRWDAAKWETELRYVLDLGFNTVRLEGKNEHPELYDVADRLGVMVMPGWECCDKWEAWSYNHDLAVPTPVWDDEDYAIAHASMLHEAAMMQAHPSVLTYLIGSDYWPDERATRLYLDALASVDWQLPVIGAASKRGFSPQTGPSGMKMDGPYDWVPPNYWYDTEPSSSRRGAAFGFGSELGAGVGTPELSSLAKFLSPSDLDDLWLRPDKDLFHMSRDPSQFENRAIYNAGLWNRWGAPSSLDDYLLKAQLTDYEATRAQFEAFAARWTAADRPATGLIYWMLNNAWPSLHWNVWDYYLRPAGSYFGAKTGSGRVEHVAFDYVRRAAFLINRSLDRAGPRTVDVQVLALDGTLIHHETLAAETQPNSSREIPSALPSVLGGGRRNLTEAVFVRLVLSSSDDNNNNKGDGAPAEVLSRNVYWIAPQVEDALDWDASTWYVTPVRAYADYRSLNGLAPAEVSASAEAVDGGADGVAVTLENRSRVPAFFVSVRLADARGDDVLPLTWDDNYVTLWPGERLTLRARAVGGGSLGPVWLTVRGKNVEERVIGG